MLFFLFGSVFGGVGVVLVVGVHADPCHYHVVTSLISNAFTSASNLLASLSDTRPIVSKIIQRRITRLKGQKLKQRSFERKLFYFNALFLRDVVQTLFCSLLF